MLRIYSFLLFKVGDSMNFSVNSLPSIRTLISRVQMKKNCLKKKVLGNVHSGNTGKKRTSGFVREVTSCAVVHKDLNP